MWVMVFAQDFNISPDTDFIKDKLGMKFQKFARKLNANNMKYDSHTLQNLFE